jgi:uridine kinase
LARLKQLLHCLLLCYAAFMSYSAADLEKVNHIVTQRRSDRVMLMAIDGHSAAGKTTLSNHIRANYSDVTVVRTDDFYRVLAQEERALLDAEGGYENYYDWQRLRDEVLMPLSRKQDAVYRRYDWGKNRIGDSVQAKCAGIIVIEGCYAARPELRGYYDAVLVAKAPFERRMARQRERGDVWEWVERWDAAERYYFERYDPVRDGAVVVGAD